MSDNKILFPTVVLRGITILPGVAAHFDVAREEGVNAVNIAMMGNQQIFLVTQKDFFADNHELQDLFGAGVIAIIKQIVKLQNGSVRVLVEGKERAKIVGLKAIKNYLAADVELLPPFTVEDLDSEKVDGMVRTIRESFTNYAGVNRKIGKDAVFKVLFEPDPLKLPGIVTSIIPMKYEDKQKIL
ncbi:MAG: LON peptidase substrate-binding domain-containing protein, partial [Lachnospiraceae bacterium]|nr:LON peptidase substrate-binding domain-containing protein [Lachnospiraceae bacterium]